MEYREELKSLPIDSLAYLVINLKNMKLRLFLILAILIIGIIGFYFYDKRKHKVAIYSINFSVVKEIYNDDTERDFHQDGFSLTVDSISSNDANYFSNPPDEFFTTFPKESFHLNKYEIHKWKRTPFSIKNTIPLNFALNIPVQDTDSYIFKNRTIVTTNLAIISKKLKEPGNLYAFAFRDHPHKLYGVDLYLIDTIKHKIYVVNRQ